jgi:hypothetical protein
VLADLVGPVEDLQCGLELHASYLGNPLDRVYSVALVRPNQNI